jgi:hypothetical protein
MLAVLGGLGVSFGQPAKQALVVIYYLFEGKSD